MKKQILAVLMIAVAFMTIVSSAIGAPSVSLSTMAKSSYLSGSGFVVSSDPVVQSDAFIVFDDGVWVDLWNSEGIGSKPNSGYDDEIDVGIGWAGKLGTSGVSLDTGIYYWDLYSITKLDKDDIMQIYAEVSPSEPMFIETQSVISVSAMPFVRIETDRDLDGGQVVDFQSITYLGEKAKVAYGDHMTGSAKLSLSYDPGVFGVEPGLRLCLEESIDYKLSETFTLNPLWFRVIDIIPTGEINYSLGTGVTINF